MKNFLRTIILLSVVALSSSALAQIHVPGGGPVGGPGGHPNPGGGGPGPGGGGHPGGGGGFPPPPPNGGHPAPGGGGPGYPGNGGHPAPGPGYPGNPYPGNGGHPAPGPGYPGNPYPGGINVPGGGPVGSPGNPYPNHPTPGNPYPGNGGYPYPGNPYPGGYGHPYPNPYPYPAPSFPTLGPCVVSSYALNGYTAYSVQDGSGRVVASGLYDYGQAMSYAEELREDRYCSGVESNVYQLPYPPTPSQYPTQACGCEIMPGGDAYGNQFYRVLNSSGAILYNTPNYYDAQNFAQTNPSCF